jgi:hypothetical protein
MSAILSLLMNDTLVFYLVFDTRYFIVSVTGYAWQISDIC